MTSRHNFSDDVCKTYGADYVSIHSEEDMQDITDLSKCYKKGVYIGVELGIYNNDDDFILNWTDNTFMNDSFINWCDGFPKNLSDKSYISFHSNNSCFKNDDTENNGKGRRAICGNPYQC